MENEDILLSVTSLLYLLKEKRGSNLTPFLYNDLQHKFSKMDDSDEKRGVAFKAILPFIDEKFQIYLDYIMNSNNVDSRKKYNVIIFTVIDNEFIAVKNALNLDDFDKKDLEFKSIRFWETKLNNERYQKELSCLVTMIGDATNKYSNLVTSTVLEKYSTDLAVLIGIAAGPKNKINFSDVVIGKHIIDYESAKVIEEKTMYRPDPRRPPIGLARQVNFFKTYIAANPQKFSRNFQNLENQYFGRENPYNKEPVIKVAPILAGDKLLSDGKTIDKLVNELDDTARAVEMEANGFALACEDANVPWLVFRGISDFGDQDKQKYQDYQQSAALSAVLACKMFLEEHYNPQISLTE